MRHFTILILGILPVGFALPAERGGEYPDIVARAAICKNFYLSKLDGSGNGPWTCCCAKSQCTVSWGTTSTADLNGNLGGDWSKIDSKYQMFVAAGSRCDH
ncbi:uncharacterized protein CCOS01_17062 [Colletotrichum costaricense]|uniref:Uncharacterized protein n=1 Tax=Colletotrichum costaricense TaxID=1209916 RepID=A0AAI9YEA6_9PEZI|nr:uncharacterized protein CCOS01_17062 [Colletotrichum costaricense]KAK1503163.1 hypothetical protein CCOS01_17062 [Colletotrichum costaricense]